MSDMIRHTTHHDGMCYSCCQPGPHEKEVCVTNLLNGNLDLQATIILYRRALEFYSSKDNWYPSICGAGLKDCQHPDVSEIDCDGGDVAQRALYEIATAGPSKIAREQEQKQEESTP